MAVFKVDPENKLKNPIQSKKYSKSIKVEPRESFEKKMFLVHYYLISITITILFASDIIIILAEKFKPYFKMLFNFIS